MKTEKELFIKQFNEIKNPFLDMGEEVGFLAIAIDADKDIMYAGNIANGGIYREYEIDIDYMFSVDSNIEVLYDEIINS